MPDVLRWAGIAMLLLAAALPGFVFAASYQLVADPGGRAYLWMLGALVAVFWAALAAIPFGLARVLDRLTAGRP